jgi:hypothetical protein
MNLVHRMKEESILPPHMNLMALQGIQIGPKKKELGTPTQLS